MKTAYELRSILQPRGHKPVRDPEYRRYVKSQPCAVCGKSWTVDPCHTGPHGMAQKSCDLTCIPLCRVHHQEYDSGPRGFAERHHLDIQAIIFVLRARYYKEAA